MITYHLLDKQNEIAHFCTSREGGVSVGNYASFNLSPFSGDNPEHFSQNKQILCDKLGIESDKLIIPFQTHGTEIREINEAFFQFSTKNKDLFLNGIDALITKVQNVCIGVTTADCVPLTFYDPLQKVIAVAHAGWRGTCGRIAEKTVHAMIEKYNSNPSDIQVAIGPSISADAYSVGVELVENFSNAGFDTEQIFEKRNNLIYLDLWKANKLSLEKVGILPEHIEIAGICTFTENERFFSARRLGIKSGRLVSGIMFR